MRKLKFRFWNGIEMEDNLVLGKFGVFYVNPLNGGLDENDTASLSPYNTKLDDIEVMQYTGLTDKNGREVYENDILKHSYANLMLWVVCFEQGSFGIKNIGNNQFFRVDSPTYFIDREVVGNIYRNPELLKQGN